MNELPLQKVLYFEPCEPEIGAVYLQGELVGADMPQEASALTAHCELPVYDLRRAIHGVQMECTTWRGREAKTDITRHEESSHQGAELMSIVDVWTGGEQVSISAAGEDDQDGHVVIASDRDEAMARAATRLARGWAAPGDAVDGHVVFRRRQAYGKATEELRGRGPRHRHEWTEEMALVRAMGRRRLLEGDGGSGRQTRNSKRSGGLEAVLSVGKEVLAAACSAMADL